MLKLLKHSKLLITDSGGLQKEALWSKIPCITIREQTEWTETLEMGVNQIVGSNPDKISNAVIQILDNYKEIKQRFNKNPFGDGKASQKIIKILKNKLN